MGSNVNGLYLLRAVYPTTHRSSRGVTLRGLLEAAKPFPDLRRLTIIYGLFVVPDWTESDQTLESEADAEKILCEPHVVASLGVPVYQISNNLLKGRCSRRFGVQALVNALKTMAMSGSSWKSTLTAGGGLMSRALIEKVFDFSVVDNNIFLAQMMLQIGADPNQQIKEIYGDANICDLYDDGSISALDHAQGSQSKGIIRLLLDSGAVYGQKNLMLAILTEDFTTADRMLLPSSALDVDFNYLDVPNRIPALDLGHLVVESVTLMGLVCFWTEPQGGKCNARKRLNILEYLLRKGATISLDTMILASYCDDVNTLHLLLQHGGKVCGFNSFGFSCLAAATLREDLQADIVYLLLSLGAVVNIPRTHPGFGTQESPLHYLCWHESSGDPGQRNDFGIILDLLLNAGADINYRTRISGSLSQGVDEYEAFLWAGTKDLGDPSVSGPARAEIGLAYIGSPLEYAIIAGNESSAFRLLQEGAELIGREVLLSAKFGVFNLLKELVNNFCQDFDIAETRRNCLRLSLRWGHDEIVRFLLQGGTELGRRDILYALPLQEGPRLSTQTETQLIRATPDIEKLQIFGRSILDLCLYRFSRDTVRYILRQIPVACGSGALSRVVRSVLEKNDSGQEGFSCAEIQAMLSRLTTDDADGKEKNTALLIIAILGRVDLLRMLVIPGASQACSIKTTRLPKRHFSWFLEGKHTDNRHRFLDPTRFLGCQEWVTCSPLVGVAMTTDRPAAKHMLDHLLACSYEPDAITVIIAIVMENEFILHRFRCLKSWRSIVSIDNHDRPPWCPTALQIAAGDENIGIVNLLLEAGVSVNEVPANEAIGGYMPRTALQAAVDTGNTSLINLFIERGARINAPAAEDSGATALQVACIHGYLDITHRLLELGADVNSNGALRRGRTALEGAAEHGRIDTLQLLLNYGATTDGPHREQYIRAVLRAQWNGHLAAAALLKEHRDWTAEDRECYRCLASYDWSDE